MPLMSTLRLATRPMLINVMKTSVRHSGGNNMIIQRGTYMWNRYKDFLHFYVLLGLVPLVGITAYANIFIGHGTLTEIPEGYTPHHWEYFKHPVSRFMAKHLLYDKSRDYETMACKLQEESESMLLKKVKRGLEARMAEDNDNKSHYYTPIDISQFMAKSNRYRDRLVLHGGNKDSGVYEH